MWMACRHPRQFLIRRVPLSTAHGGGSSSSPIATRRRSRRLSRHCLSIPRWQMRTTASGGSTSASVRQTPRSLPTTVRWRSIRTMSQPIGVLGLSTICCSTSAARRSRCFGAAWNSTRTRSNSTAGLARPMRARARPRKRSAPSKGTPAWRPPIPLGTVILACCTCTCGSMRRPSPHCSARSPCPRARLAAPCAGVRV